MNFPGTVVAAPQYQNTVQGTISESSNPLALAISGQGFFQVSESTGINSVGATQFSNQAYFTRDGDFQVNSSGYLTNDAGQYLNGYVTNAATGVLNTSGVVPIQVSQSVYQPVPTQTMTMAANLPAGEVSTVTEDANGNVNGMFDSSANAVPSMQPEAQVYDAEGTAHTVQYTWAPVPNNAPVTAGGSTYATVANTWTLSASIGTGANAKDLGEIQVNFNSDGTLAGITPPTPGAAGAVIPAGSGTATPGGTLAGAVPTFSNATTGTVTFDTGMATSTAGVTQKITLNLGVLGKTAGVTQFSGSSFTLSNLSQDGVPPGDYTGVSTTTTGNIYANYSNGQTRLVGQVPVATFAAADQLQSQNGSSYTATLTSGTPSLQSAGTNGAGALVTNSVESSNVDIASQFTSLIVAQQAYTANTKVVTTADQLMQATINMKT